MITELIVLISILLILWNILKKPSSYPPGPWGLPLLGSIPFDLQKFQDNLEELRRKHGDVFSWRIGSRLFVFLCEPKLIKEAFQNDTFANRLDLKALSFFEGKQLGLVNTNGSHWKHNRIFTLHHLRNLGMGKSKLIPVIEFEAKEFVKIMEKRAGQPTLIPEALAPALINVLWQMIASKRYDVHDQKIIRITRLLLETDQNIAQLMFEDIFPWAKTLLPKNLLAYITNSDSVLEISRVLDTEITEEINDHLEKLNINNPRDYIDYYLIQMKKENQDSNSTMSVEDLKYCMADLFGALLESTTITIFWAIFYLAAFPEIQEKLQKEIDNVLPKGSSFNLEDKKRMPYTEAFLAEVLRYSSFAVFRAFHTVSKDIKLAGYVIPKDCVIAATLSFIHHDPKYYSCPDEFKPERFLNSDGKFESKKDIFIPFGTGKRQCLGESLARMELFVFLTTMLQTLHFSAPPNKTIDLTPAGAPMLRHPDSSQQLVFTIRK